MLNQQNAVNENGSEMDDALQVQCKYNRHIDCSRHICDKCGWNPTAPKREVNWIEPDNTAWKY